MTLRYDGWTEARRAQLKPEVGPYEAGKQSLREAMHRHLREYYDIEDRTRVMFESLLDYLDIED